jgi:hypothetical protein
LVHLGHPGWHRLDDYQVSCLDSALEITPWAPANSRSNIGQNVKALWKLYDSSVDEAFLVYRQQLHVSILSIASFGGRLLSGKHTLHRERFDPLPC